MNCCPNNVSMISTCGQNMSKLVGNVDMCPGHVEGIDMSNDRVQLAKKYAF